ncbi:O-antigen ligase family protein [Candidatus Hydrogenedentota bacterium]
MKQAHSSRNIFYGLTAAIGLVLGCVVLCVANLEAKWIFGITASFVIAVAVVLYRDLKVFVLMLLTLLLSVNADLNFFYREHYGSAGGLYFSAVDLCLLVLIVHWAFRASARKPHEARRLPTVSKVMLCAAAALLAAGGISTILVADDRIVALFAWCRLLACVMLFLYLAFRIDSAKLISRILLCLCTTLVIQGVFATTQVVTGSTLGLGFLGEDTSVIEQQMGSDTLTRAGGTLGHPNGLASYLEIVLPFAMALVLVEARMAHRAAGIIGLLFGTVALILTLSRGGFLGTVAGLGAIMLLFLIRSRRRSKAFAVSLVGALSILVVCLFLNEALTARFLREDYGEAFSRVPMMEVAFSMIGDNPIMGVGLNNYALEMAKYDSTVVQISSFFPYPVHNLFLLVTAEMGPVVCLALLIFVGALIWMSFQLSASDDWDLRAVGLGTLGASIAFFMHAQVNVFHIETITMVWFVAGLSLAAFQVERNRQHSETQ